MRVECTLSDGRFEVRSSVDGAFAETMVHCSGAFDARNGWQYVTLISPIFVFVLLTRISGVPLLERRGMKRWGDEPDYREYVATTPVLIPRPPR